ncbi:hypothetical protein RND71_008289 [Anisodus tanguticus]|uniref:Uncharacterized protein n=1 Tax=Anisodus tanguticus TaxID=243964 RepID=A0AAE1SNG4_9SOLA|nr:hypothetical protein RND71_008289 [Anisodus tanguticus]
MTFIYGYNTNAERKDVWEKLRLLHPAMSELWIILGDFNTGLSISDRINGALVHQVEIQDFIDCVEDIGASHLPKSGCEYSWCNKRDAYVRIYSKIDWDLGNHHWFMKYGRLEAFFGNPECSDHSPIIIDTIMTHQPSHRPFKLLNVLMKQDRFEIIVKQKWAQQITGHTMFRVWNKLQAIARHAKTLNKEMSTLDVKLEGLKAKLVEWIWGCTPATYIITANSWIR